MDSIFINKKFRQDLQDLLLLFHGFLKKRESEIRLAPETL
jgi:hypothetical protein